jgi:hypothetical protein
VRIESIIEKTSGRYAFTLVDEGGAIPTLATLTLTLFNAEVAEPSPATGNIINSRDAQNVLNLNNVTYSNTTGECIWQIQVADTPIVDATKGSELHIARFDFTYGSPVRTGRHEVGLRVRNLRKVA